MISKISEMSEEELQKISAGFFKGPITESFFFLPATVVEFIKEHTPLSDEKSSDLVGLPIAILQCVAVWEGGKWLYKKGKNSWLPKLKEKLSKKKD